MLTFHAPSRTGSAGTARGTRLLALVAGCVRKHHNQRLVIHTVQDVVHTPTGRGRYLPHEAEGAMGTLKTGL